MHGWANRLYGRSIVRDGRGALAAVALVVGCFAEPAMGFAGERGGAAARYRNAELMGMDAWTDVFAATRSGVARDVATERRVEALLDRLSVEEKVGQIIQADIGSVTPAEARRYRLGSILAGGNSAPDGNLRSGPKAWLGLADAFYDAMRDVPPGRPYIPLIFGIDAVHGHNNVMGATIFPHNVGLGAMRNPGLIRRIGEVTAREVAATGIDWTFAPTVAVARDSRWGRAYESYAEDPRLVASYARQMVLGLQGVPGTDGFLGAGKVVATVKHFVGDGGTRGGLDQGDTQLSPGELSTIHAAGYPPAIEAGARSVMASFNSWSGEKLHGHKGLLTDVLRGRYGFTGFVVGDWNGHGQVPGCTNTDCPQALNAGLDMYMAPDSWKGLYERTLANVKSGAIAMDRLDEAVRRIVRVKMEAGLFEAASPSKRPLGGRFDLIGHPDHRAISRQAVRESLVLLKKNNGLLPIAASATILVAGDGADNMSKQTGGWTLSWQGDGNGREHFPNGSTIFEGIEAAVEGKGRAYLSAEGAYTQRPDVAIVVFGEDPYAEFKGDLKTLAYSPDESRDLDLLKRLKADGIPVVAVFLSGRPLWVNREINASDAFVAAWLPGSEGGGIADVLIGDADGKARHDFMSALPFSWPRKPLGGPLNVGDKDYDPLFPFGFGLSYMDNGDLAPLGGPLNVGDKDYDPLFPFGFGLSYMDNGDLAPLSENAN